MCVKLLLGHITKEEYNSIVGDRIQKAKAQIETQVVKDVKGNVKYIRSKRKTKGNENYVTE